jgi:predicted amidohydrolase
MVLPECADHHRTNEAIAAHESGSRAAVRETLGLSLESPWLQQVMGLARKHKTVIVPCVVHKDGPRTYTASLVFGPDGALLGSYNKTHLAPGEERVLDWGNHLDPIPTPFGRIGIQICWDFHFPEISRVYELKGAELQFWTTMRQGWWERELYHAVLPARCFTHGTPLGVSTFALDEQLLHRGVMNSAILDAFGQTLAGGIQGSNGFVSATVDLDQRPQTHKEWNVPELVDYPRYLQTQRRTDLYSVLTAPLPGKSV